MGSSLGVIGWCIVRPRTLAGTRICKGGSRFRQEQLALAAAHRRHVRALHQQRSPRLEALMSPVPSKHCAAMSLDGRTVSLEDYHRAVCGQIEAGFTFGQVEHLIDA